MDDRVIYLKEPKDEQIFKSCILDTTMICDSIQKDSKSYRESWIKAKNKIVMRNRISRLFRSLANGEKNADMHEYLKKKYFGFDKDTIKKPDQSKYIFDPNTSFISFWNIFIAFILIFSAFENPYTLSFTDLDKNGPISMIDLTIDFVFLIDLIVNFNLGYFDDDGRLICSRRDVMLNYLKTWFFIDAISSIPFTLIELFSNNNSEILIRIKTIPRLLRLSRTFKLLKSLERLESINLFMDISQRTWRFLRVMFGLVLALHICACLWHYSAKFYDYDVDTWVTRYSLNDLPADERYLTSLYWALTTLATIGYGDITPRSTAEKLIAMIWMILAVYVLSFSVGSLAAAAASSETRDRLINQKIALIEKFGKMSRVPKTVMHSMKRYIRLNSEISNLSQELRSNMLNGLQLDLKFEVACNVYKKAIPKFVFFTSRSESFTSSFALFLEVAIFNKKDLIWKSGEAAIGIYFINSGLVSFHIRSDELKFKVEGEGYHFGDYEVVKKIERKFTVRAVGLCELLVMSNNVVERIPQEFPKIWEDISKLAEIRAVKLFQYAAEMIVAREIKDSNLDIIGDVHQRIKKEREKIDANEKFDNEDISVIHEKVKELTDRVKYLENIISDFNN